MRTIMNDNFVSEVAQLAGNAENCVELHTNAKENRIDKNSELMLPFNPFDCDSDFTEEIIAHGFYRTD
jgi:hypothetical protein